ncbi:MAG: iron transporter [Planctomycetaceae bacterium]|nr:iron transporter [Planctomycetaceae bacterium]
MVVAATGVGAGDLATGALAGSNLGIAVVWAVVVGAIMKWILTEGLARWQLATNTTLLEGVAKHFGIVAQLLFLAYLILWSFFVGVALVSACAATARAIYSWHEHDLIFYGVGQAAIAVGLVKLGGYRLFEKLMSVCIGVMFVTVIVAAVAVQPSWSDLLFGFVPSIPQGDGLGWTVALIGGVGGTATILCYGYWIQEKDRHGPEFVRICRIDLAAGYAMTASFGIGMVILGSRVDVEGKGAVLLVNLAQALRAELSDGVGGWAAWFFLIGAWGAVFSSLLGCCQSVPYIFADCWRLLFRSSESKVDTTSKPYQFYMYALAIVSSFAYWLKEVQGISFAQVQKIYAIVGAAFIPILALALLVMNWRVDWIGEKHRSSIFIQIVLLATVAFFLFTVVSTIKKQFG